MKNSFVLSVCGALLFAGASIAAACPESSGSSASTQCTVHKSHTRHAQSASAANTAAEAPAPSAVIDVHAVSVSSATTASRTQRCQSFGQACDAAPTGTASVNHAACCDDAANANHAAVRATPAAPTTVAAKDSHATKHAVKNPGAEADAPAFGPLFLAHRTLML
jgi:hypothetical protein